MDKSNNAIAVWCQVVSGPANLYSNVYNASDSSWYTEGQGADLLENEGLGDVESPRIAMNSFGNATAAWSQWHNTPQVSYRNVKANQYVIGSRWSAGNAINVNTYANDTSRPDVAMDAAGNAVVVWSMEWWGEYDVFARTRRTGVGWTAPTFLEDHRNGPTSTSDTQDERVAVNAGGSGMAVWRDFDGFRWNAYANHIVLPDLTPPSWSWTSPTNGLETTIPVVTVAGTVEANVKLVVNGIYVDTSSGTFSANIALQVGDNPITVTATDAAGNSATDIRTVKYKDPIPTLQAQVAQIASDLATVWDQANATQTGLTALGTEVSTLGSELTALQTQVSALGSELTALQAQVSALRTQLTTAYAGLNSSQTQVTAALSDISALETQLDALQTQLGATRTTLNTTQTDLTAVQDDVDGKATSSSPMMWAIIAIIVSVIAAVGLNMFLGKKKP
jgi:peptidoglycan hydrolase CwlO-like protein